jgi:lysine-specific demethylase 8
MIGEDKYEDCQDDDSTCSSHGPEKEESHGANIVESTDPNDTSEAIEISDEVVEDEREYSCDEIAEFLSTLPSPLNIGSEDDWDDIFTPLDGTAHLSTLTKMNHSCSPNVVILYKTRGWGKDHPLVAYCIALRDIIPGEELTISYIKTDVSYEERQSALANYGFSCKCIKCEIGAMEPSECEPCETEKTTLDQTCPDEDDLFGSDTDDEDEDNNTEEEGLFESDNDNESKNNHEEDDHSLDGETKLQNVAERFESFLNKSINAAIPLKYLAPASTYVIKFCNSILKEVDGEGAFEDTKSLLNNCIAAIQERDFDMCRVVGPDLELALYQQLKKKGSWPHMVHRHVYWCACTTAAIGYAQEASFLVAMKYLDKALIMGQYRRDVEGFFSYVEHFAFQMAAAPCPPAIDCKVSNILDPDVVKILLESGLSKSIDKPVPETTIDRFEFVKSLTSLTEPLVMRSLAEEWSAVYKWRNIDQLAREHGHRLIPIEVGSIDTGMKEELVSFRSFVTNYLSQSAKNDCTRLEEAVDPASSIAYLAQHPLLNQISNLHDDVPKTPFGLEPTNINIWLGTGGTRTPLHFDSYDNLFVQLVGAKYVRLYRPDQTSKLYVSKDSKYGLQGNMSQVNCEMEDFDSHPLAKDCEYTEVLLLPGDALFIPSRYWHYVRSLSTSVSINYWF